MPRSGYTHIEVLLDRSGSMAEIKEDMEGGYNTFLQEQQEQPGEATVGLSQFDTTFDVVYSLQPVAKAPKLNLEPRGGTALIDAICKGVDALGQTLRNIPEHRRPAQVIYMIITDGQENSSREFRLADVQSRISRQRDQYGWEFMFLGANQDALMEARQYGIPAAAAMTYDSNSVGTSNAYAAASSNVSSLRGGRIGNIQFTEEERQAASKSGSGSSTTTPSQP